MASSLAKEFDSRSVSEDVRDRVNKAGGPNVVPMGEKHSDPAADTIKSDEDVVACATCGADKATMKCKKRHGRCDNKRFCSRECERKSHEKPEKGDNDEDEVGNVEMDFAAILDAQLAKENKKMNKKERQAKLLYGVWTSQDF